MVVKLKFSPVCISPGNVSLFVAAYYQRIHFKIDFIFLYFSMLELAQLSGIAAILRFPMPELEEESNDDGEDEEEEDDSNESDSDS